MTSIFGLLDSIYNEIVMWIVVIANYVDQYLREVLLKQIIPLLLHHHTFVLAVPQLELFEDFWPFDRLIFEVKV